MKLIVAFLRLIRGLNLVFIVLTQFLFHYFIIVPILRDALVEPLLNNTLLVLLSLSSIFVAAAGYIINDYFDLNIDQVNKPEKIVVEKVIKRRWAIMWHWILSFAGIALGFYVGWKVGLNFILGFSNLLCVVLLWFYSTTFKKKLLIGNIIISLLTSWVVLVVMFAESRLFVNVLRHYKDVQVDKILRLSFLYAGFAFIISLVREVVKDIEDIQGDSKHGCRTMPIVWGINVSKMFGATWLFILLAALLILLVYVLQFRWWLSAIYCLLFIIVPLVYILRKLFSAHDQKDFHQLSGWIKFLMFTGIISMVFFKIYS